MRYTAQVLHTAHTTRLYKCCTQLIQLNKHSAMKKEESYILKGQHRWQPSSLTAVLMWFFSTEQQVHPHWHHCCCSHCLRWQWERHYCVQNSNINSHKGEGNNVRVVKNEGPVSCQLRDMYLYDTYIVVVVVGVVAAELVVWESVLTYSTKKGFTYKSCEWRSW